MTLREARERMDVTKTRWRAYSASCLRSCPSCNRWVEWYNQGTIGGATTLPREAQGGACRPFGRIAK